MLYIKLKNGSIRRINLHDINKERSLAKRFQLKQVSPDKALKLSMGGGKSEHIYVRDIEHMTAEDNKTKPSAFGGVFDNIFDDIFDK